MTELVRNIHFSGAYDLRGKPPQRNFGIHGMELHFSVKGPKGAITATIYTTWYLPEQQQSTYEMYSKYSFEPAENLCAPNFVDIGYHAKEAQYEGQTCRPDCALTDGAPCYYDGSGLWGNECWREGFLHGGSDWLFERMEQEYRHRFEGGEAPDLTPIPRKHPDEVS